MGANRGECDPCDGSKDLGIVRREKKCLSFSSCSSGKDLTLFDNAYFCLCACVHVLLIEFMLLFHPFVQRPALTSSHPTNRCTPIRIYIVLSMVYTGGSSSTIHQMYSVKLDTPIKSTQNCYLLTADQTKNAIGSNNAITTDPPYAAILALPAVFFVFLASGSTLTFN